MFLTPFGVQARESALKANAGLTHDLNFFVTYEWAQ